MFTTAKSVLKPAQLQQVRFSAQSKKKRIDIQLLKDFPGYGVKGQIIKVKPSAMTNKFHPNNGAVYLNYPGAEPAIPVASQADINKAKDRFTAEQKAKQESQQLKKKQLEHAEAQSAKKELNTLSLDQILNIDFNVLTDAQLKTIFEDLPKNFVFVKKTTVENTLEFPISEQDIKKHIQTVLSKSMRQKDNVVKFTRSKSTSVEFKTESGDAIAEVNTLGTYFATVSNGSHTSEVTVTVNEAK